MGPTPDSLPRPLEELMIFSSFQPSCASRACASTAGSRRVALDVSVLLVLVDADGCFDAAAFGFPLPNEPSPWSDSAARESEVTMPTPS